MNPFPHTGEAFLGLQGETPPIIIFLACCCQNRSVALNPFRSEPVCLCGCDYQGGRRPPSPLRHFKKKGMQLLEGCLLPLGFDSMPAHHVHAKGSWGGREGRRPWRHCSQEPLGSPRHLCRHRKNCLSSSTLPKSIAPCCLLSQERISLSHFLLPQNFLKQSTWERRADLLCWGIPQERLLCFLSYMLCLQKHA